MERPTGYTARIEAKGHKTGEGWPYGTRKWGVTIVNTRTGKSASFQYYTGPAIKETPTLRDVAQALISDGRFYEDNPTPEEFARESGYEYGDPELTKSFNACKHHAEAMHRVFGEDLDAMSEWSFQ